ncbi:hypothetical protein [Aurantiacibacter spongiae]|uniref:DUF3035 domain-containing protein n=1 Tax=Aurantiacibacter spongiae TaxID=2488860 RepID=A0A3N5CPQ3_9SPHN|nr:hypothetical protein [Aurantiacibacter spongiae]RPF70974.1 hypothetical protein EG799_04590 [Aurantiacibacter spongiae]
MSAVLCLLGASVILSGCEDPLAERQAAAEAQIAARAASAAPAAPRAPARTVTPKERDAVLRLRDQQRGTTEGTDGDEPLVVDADAASLMDETQGFDPAPMDDAQGFDPSSEDSLAAQGWGTAAN